MKTISLVLCVLCSVVQSTTLLCADAFGQGCQGVQSSCAGNASVSRSRPIRAAVGGVLQKISSRRASASMAASCGSSVPVQSSCAGATSCAGVNTVPTYAPTACSVEESVPNNFAPTSDAYQRAYASAAQRANRRFKGHVAGELISGRANSAGVGYSSFNSNPRTCLGVPGQTSATCAVVRGSDGWYSTCVK